MKSILDPSFRYTNSVETDLRKTFAKIRRELRYQQQDRATVDIEVTRIESHVRSPACVPEP